MALVGREQSDSLCLAVFYLPLAEDDEINHGGEFLGYGSPDSRKPLAWPLACLVSGVTTCKGER